MLQVLKEDKHTLAQIARATGLTYVGVREFAKSQGLSYTRRLNTGKMPLSSDTKKEIVRLYRQHHVTRKELATQFGISVVHLHRIAKQA